MIALYLDEDSERTEMAAALRRAGIQVTRTHDAGNAGRPDPEQLAFAAAHGMVIVTANLRDYQVLHREWTLEGRDHAGIILRIQQRNDFREELRRLIRLATHVTPETARNQVLFLSRWRSSSLQ